MISFAERLVTKIDVRGPDDCWPWLAGTNNHGYPKINLPFNAGLLQASRALSIALDGPIVDEHEVCHDCDTPWCMNPAHHFRGTHAENMADMVRKGRWGGRRRRSQRSAYSASRRPARDV